VFVLLTAIGSFMIVANIFIPYFAFDDDTRMFIECGWATVQISALVMAVWTASTSVADEIEGKTAMTLLSKPITRQNFIFGKFLGIVQSALLMLVCMSFVLFCSTYFKFGYDSGEHGAVPPPLFSFPGGGWVPALVPQRFEVAMSIVPGIGLIALEVIIMSAVSVAISTQFPMLVNVLSCLAVFVLGHLTPLLVLSGAHPVVRFVAQVFATIFPVLDYFNVQGASLDVPPIYLLSAFAYCCAYSVLMLMVALIRFEDRDLA
jgi:ABC-type transport system involved in multi-copper enzyme maturation permease subunit